MDVTQINETLGLKISLTVVKQNVKLKGMSAFKSCIYFQKTSFKITEKTVTFKKQCCKKLKKI